MRKPVLVRGPASLLQPNPQAGGMSGHLEQRCAGTAPATASFARKLIDRFGNDREKLYAVAETLKHGLQNRG